MGVGRGKRPVMSSKRVSAERLTISELGEFSLSNREEWTKRFNRNLRKFDKDGRRNK